MDGRASGGKKDGREGFSGCDYEFAIEATDGVSVHACILDSARSSCFRAGPFQRPTSNLAAARVHNRLAAPAAQHHADQIQFSHSPTTLAFIHRKYGKRCRIYGVKRQCGNNKAAGQNEAPVTMFDQK
ncbi:uncharacterized protein PSANT_06508 [Moesziomyces antarcticus]|uniref:Uncharacterized protein n=1 Tax=Pseudozyma antarctica TaxID=84753 RepID=A0A5C3FZ47_PSEA2|nr:uncharacterized protein PSANT_06508 [Moesziomyces antarcticus]